jgi:hypothetical protein
LGGRQKNSSWMLSGSRKVTMALDVWLDVAAGFVHAEEIAVPGCALVSVADGQDDNLAG